MNKNRRVALVILDGWGLGLVPDADAIKKAKTPFFDKMMREESHATLVTYGKEVGLPDGQMGNSEVGHLNIGAGRVVYQDLLRINNSIAEGSFYENAVLKDLIAAAKTNGKKLHLIGLLSDGGVHSHIEHLKALVNLLEAESMSESFIHAFMDGRDTDPKGGIQYLEELQQHLKGKSTQVASIIGRYYAMDRDNRWERIKLAYDLLVRGEGKASKNLNESLKASYEAEVTDEFVLPHFMADQEGHPIATIEEGDSVLFFNFRTDRPRQLTAALSQQDFPEQGMKKLELHFATMTSYNSEFQGLNIVFPESKLKNTLGEVVASSGRTQLRAAETEKYPHVTFFLSGGIEKVFEGEHRIMEPSPKVATYDLQPEMSAPALAEKVATFIKEKLPDFVVLNIANPDMVGHTGVFEAVVKAVETTDKACQLVAETALEKDYLVIVIADHGNADFMVLPDGRPHTAHTTNLVPMVVLDKNQKWKVRNGKLADIAPSILHLMQIEKPAEMDGKQLIYAENDDKMDLLPLLKIALSEDIGNGDHSSLACIPADAVGKARLLIKDDGVLAGVDLAKIIFELVDPEIEMEIYISDGAEVQKGDVGFIVTGKRQSLLKAERLVLNFMQRMSGIATKTKEFAELVAGTKARVLDTRKTTPGLRQIEKWAVRIGGGHNHRMGLYDMIMLKDNHVDFAGGIPQAVAKTRKYLADNNLDIRVELEVRNEEELKLALETGGVDRIMLDNFSPDRIKNVIDSIPEGVEVEASGGITRETIRAYAETGVDFISVGALTHSYRSMDISLKAIDPA